MTVPTKRFSEAGVSVSVANMLAHAGFDVGGSDALRGTPGRVARSLKELLAGYDVDTGALLSVTFDDPHDQIVLLRDVSFYSTCEHHLLPFFGRASVAYLPDRGVVGLSKLARLVEAHARRLQLQERMTRDIAADLVEHLRPRGAAVHVAAQHMCMCARGVEKPGATMVTSAVCGVFKESESARAELMSLLSM